MNLRNIRHFYLFMLEREFIRMRRADGLKGPWTVDPVLAKYSFTNVKRLHDRTTQGFKRIYDQYDEADCREVLLNCAINRFFGTVEFAEALGWQDYVSPDHDQNGFDDVRDRLVDTAQVQYIRREPVFTGAYIVPNCGDSRKKHEVVADILHEIWKIIPKAVDASYCADNRSWEILCRTLCEARGVGSFMAKEVVLDFCMALDWIPDDWTTWTPVGPGARRGAARVLSGGELVRIRDDSDGSISTPQGLPEREALEVIRALWAERDVYWPREADYSVTPDVSITRPMIELDLTDIQFQLCEYDKYMRVHLNEGKEPKKLFKPRS